MDKKFEGRRMCDRKRIKIVVSYLSSYALTWWENLCDSDRPQTWNDMKILLREKFAQHHLKDHITFVSPSVTNILQEQVQKKRTMRKMTSSHQHMKYFNYPLILCI